MRRSMRSTPLRCETRLGNSIHRRKAKHRSVGKVYVVCKGQPAGFGVSFLALCLFVRVADLLHLARVAFRVAGQALEDIP